MGLGLLVSSGILGLMILAVGVICIIFAFREKRRLLVIHSFRYTVPIFMTKSPDLYQQFSANVMTIVRQLNAPAPAPQPNRPTQARSTNGADPQSMKANK
jgi:hypothetical protein